MDARPARRVGADDRGNPPHHTRARRRAAPQDGFDLPWAAALRRGLAGLDALGPDARPGLRALRALVLPRRDEILAQLARLEGLRETVRHLRGPLVLCHTDIIGDNLLVDDQRRLSVLDWDEARVAPPEYDLYEVCDGDFARFLAVYCAAGGSGPLRLDHFAFALLRRAVGDMAVRLLSVVDEDRAPEVEAEALNGIEAWGFARWRGIDATLAALAPTLRQHDAHEQPSAET
ncbi:MAG: hypothetical protein AVDCRST_MAG18-2022 [uncultured Thermomicrobiales bacterium]|uniref:Aminoglycoside phosphotransferase domain-containing protein n=1 Tax=uncultured Thermomicrobiales bacterium TaxID=1645740 RepID=A0A6J4V8B8_9BACT|nr:MAG: hypothetical protein AVDCRST_MAG18-2022 [uncultured Thermomicrobiales bacterium]